MSGHIADDHQSLLGQVEQLARDLHPDLVSLRHDLHRHPELSNRERRTAGVVAGVLREAGLDEVRTGVAGHGVVGVLRGGVPGDRVIALRADMDALPVRESSGVEFASAVVDRSYPGGPFPVAHACGHDCHTATVATAARLLARVRDRLPGTVVFVFQPAEEGPPVGEVGGARAMVGSGVLNDVAPTMVFGLHVEPLPLGIVGYCIGNQMAASCLVKVTVRGVQTHASAPWRGRDPMPAAAGIVLAAAQLYRQVPAHQTVAVSFGHLADVGRFNIIGETVVLWGTLRCLAEQDMTTLQEALRSLAVHQAAAFGCTAEVEYLQSVPPVHNSAAWIEAVLPSVRRVVGSEQVVQVRPSMGYDDVSEFLNAFGGVYLTLGVQDVVLSDGEPVAQQGGRGLAPTHSPGFYADDDVLVTSLHLHAAVAVDHLMGVIQPSLPDR